MRALRRSATWPASTCWTWRVWRREPVAGLVPYRRTGAAVGERPRVAAHRRVRIQPKYVRANSQELPVFGSPGRNCSCVSTVGLIELLPDNRIRRRIARNFAWLPGGPIHRYFVERVQGEFLSGAFDPDRDAQRFAWGMVSEQSATALRAKVAELMDAFDEVTRRDEVRADVNARGTCLLVAFRQWEPLHSRPCDVRTADGGEKLTAVVAGRQLGRLRDRRPRTECSRSSTEPRRAPRSTSTVLASTPVAVERRVVVLRREISPTQWNRDTELMACAVTPGSTCGRPRAAGGRYRRKSRRARSRLELRAESLTSLICGLSKRSGLYKMRVSHRRIHFSPEDLIRMEGGPPQRNPRTVPSARRVPSVHPY